MWTLHQLLYPLWRLARIAGLNTVWTGLDRMIYAYITLARSSISAAKDVEMMNITYAVDAASNVHKDAFSKNMYLHLIENYND